MWMNARIKVVFACVLLFISYGEKYLRIERNDFFPSNSLIDD